jgi:zinc protease
MLLRLLRPLLAACAVSLAARAAADPEIKFEKYQLPNGLTVILSEDHRLPQVAVDIWYHVGAANQTPGKSGFAHLFEHMMFSGSKHIQPTAFKVLEQVGASQVNGTTNDDRTNYFEVVPSSELPSALWLESDRMGFLLDTLDDQKLKVQRDVVSNERRQSYENRPYGTTQLEICDLLYPKPHPYFDCVIGDIAEIQSASPADVRAFFRQFYGPNNASLAIVGDFDPQIARQQVEQFFGPIPRGPDDFRPDVPQPLLKGVIKKRIDDKLAELPRLVLVWNGLKRFADDEASGDVLAEILGGGKTSRFYKTLVFDKQVASGVSANNPTLELGGSFEIAATANQGHTVAELLPLVQGILDDVKKNGVTAQEVERARRNILANTLRTVERIGGFGGKADLLNTYETFLGDPGFLPRDLARYRAVTPASVQAFANKRLPDDRRIELDVEPMARSAQGDQ